MQRIAFMVVILVVVGGSVAIVYGFAARSERIVQPIVFNHVVHLEEAGMECIECHTHAATGVSAGLPGKGLCYDCHDIDDEVGAHAEKDKLFAFDELDEDLPWQRVALTRPDVFFSHRRHVGSANLECTECHQDQRTLTTPPPFARLVMAMDTCIQCHKESGASSDCLACHR